MLFRRLEKSIAQRGEPSLRDVALPDVARIAELAGEWDVASMTGRIPYPYTEAAACQWVEDLAPGEKVRAIIVDSQFIGVCGLTPDRGDEKVAELGYWIGKPYWGRGYATSAVRILINWAFDNAGLKRLTASHTTDNPASGRVLEKLGFRPVGATLCWCEARSREVDVLSYELDAPRGWWRRR